MLPTPLLIFLMLLTAGLRAQKDTVSIRIEPTGVSGQLNVLHEMTLYTSAYTDGDTLRLFNRAAALMQKAGPLYRRTMENRNRTFHFAKKNQLAGIQINQLSVNHVNLNLSDSKALQVEVIKLPLPKSASREPLSVTISYQLQLPAKEIIGEGFDNHGWSCKYMFLAPASKSEIAAAPHFLAVGEIPQRSIFYHIDLSGTDKWTHKLSNLPRAGVGSFAGQMFDYPEIAVSDQEGSQFSFSVGDKSYSLALDFTLPLTQQKYLQSYLPHHYQFLKDQGLDLPQYIFITRDFFEENNFYGNDDIDLKLLTLPLFSENINIDLDFFSVISKKAVLYNYPFAPESGHWIINGLKTYYEINYLKKYYPKTKLLGDLTERTFFGLKPLSWFSAGKVPLLRRYELGYRATHTQNVDQPLTTRYSALSNFNIKAISHFESGMLFYQLATIAGQPGFKNFLSQCREKGADIYEAEKFVENLHRYFGADADFFLQMLPEKNRVNVGFSSDSSASKHQPVVSSNLSAAVPSLLQKYGDGQPTETKIIHIPKEGLLIDEQPERDIHWSLNADYLFPEADYRDNFSKRGLLGLRPLTLKIIRDLPRDDRQEIYIAPRFSFNAYDRILAGVNFKNSSLFPQSFNFSVTPYYSFGERQLTGSGSVSYHFFPVAGPFQRIVVGGGGSFYHYDYNLMYRKYSGSISFLFQKEARSTVSQGLSLGYSHYDRDLRPRDAGNYPRYNLWNISYGYAAPALIHERFLSAGVQGMADFVKVSAEGYYRYEFAPRRKASVRLFTGVFLRNETASDLFDFGISGVSNYSFSYGLLGQSSTSGILSQQFVQAEGGFKSYVGDRASQWISSVNTDVNLWKIFHAYADAGMYKDRSAPAKFIWDSGIRITLIPDFAEIYFPVASSLGFEPGMPKYFTRIRYSLVINAGSIIRALRRGQF